jgi:hypothetical protein
MGKNPIDYNKLRELGMKVLISLSTESWVHQEYCRSQSLYKDCTKSSCYLRMICSLQKGNFFDSSD